ncbi:tRNA lysidine(34) synthetase TilS [Candidatus Binatus soli]|jgi:tRNA(Ile)-lysidine synthase|uniref:tRNA lysidine(34) synthetase TilS n=1 Tax=Candidatus Binatus soli TaxID=1953413 RepID=UPI003D0F7D15
MGRDAEKTVVGAIEAALARAGVRRGASILIGLSGGADSVALTCALLELRERLGPRVAAAHLNHRIRGDESDRDEAFVRAMCARLGVELIVERAEGLDAAISSANLEERAREVRRDFLGRVADRIGADFLALGHHRDDQAETVLMRLMRGAGAAGMAAMAERGPGRLIRPMLSISRADIRGYLDARAIAFVEDSTNSSRDILRNRIRAELLPMLEREYAPGLGGRLVEVAAEMRSLDDLVAAIAARELDAARRRGGALDVSGFSGVNRAVQAVAIRLFLSERMGSLRKISRAHIEAVRQLILEGGPSDSLDLPGGWRAEREYNFFRLVHSRAGSKTGAAGFSVAIAAHGITVVEAAGFKFEASTNPAAAGAAADASMPDSLLSSSLVAMFDAAEIADAGLVARNFMKGDRMHPMGMRGTRKVHDVFVDRKWPRARRERFPVVTVGGEIAWLPGLARADCALVTKATETVLRVEAREIAA